MSMKRVVGAAAVAASRRHLRTDAGPGSALRRPAGATARVRDLPNGPGGPGNGPQGPNRRRRTQDPPRHRQKPPRRPAQQATAGAQTSTAAPSTQTPRRPPRPRRRPQTTRRPAPNQSGARHTNRHAVDHRTRKHVDVQHESTSTSSSQPPRPPQSKHLDVQHRQAHSTSSESTASGEACAEHPAPAPALLPAGGLRSGQCGNRRSQRFASLASALWATARRRRRHEGVRME